MVSKKRVLEEPSSSRESKKPKNFDAPSTQPTTLITADEIDFPRGGGTALTALEVKATRAEGVKEANAELFNEKEGKAKSGKKKKKRKTEEASGATEKKSDKIRIEHLNYKRLNVGMKIMGQIVGVLPLALLVSLPNQLLAHVPITNISSQYTSRLERMEEEMDTSDNEDEAEPGTSRLPELGQIFKIGQYVRAVVSATHAPGSSDPSGLFKSRDEVAKACRRVELSLLPKQVNEGVQKGDLKAGFALTAAVQSIEDHGYILDLGVPGVDGFISFKDMKSTNSEESLRLSIGQIVETTVVKLSSNQRSCTVTVDPTTFKSSSNSQVTSVNSVLPGSLVQALVTEVSSEGVVLQLLGFFDGTVDRIHLRHEGKALKVGQKVKGRVLYQYSADPPRFAVALSQHLVDLDVRRLPADDGKLVSMQERYPLGTILDSVKVVKIESERGLYLEVGPGFEGFVHISHVSDDHLPSLANSSPWKLDTLHRGRVTGYHGFDGMLQISLKPSIFEHEFLQLTDFKAGQLVKATIKNVSDSALFVSLPGNIDAVVWPNHFADIRLKHPAKRFKPGANIKCKVLVVDPERKRIALTAKKTLLESDLPVISKFEDARPGVVAHGVVFRVSEKHVMVEFFNNLKALVPIKEASDTPNIKLADAFPIGRVVRVQIMSADSEQNRIIASVRQALVSKEPIPDVSAVEIGDSVEGAILEVHAEHVLVSLEPSKVRALVSIKNLANHRKLSPAQVHASLRVGDPLDELVVVTRNPEKGIVIAAKKPKARPTLPAKGQPITIDTVTVGQLVGGRVTRHTRHGTLVKITSQIGGIIYHTDTSDNYESPFLPLDSIIKASVLSVDKERRQLTLSTRESRLHPDKEHVIVDREIGSISDLAVGDTVRGYIKNIAEHGLFVTVGRGVDARVQIRELFDEFVKEWKPKFKENQLVKGRVLSADIEKNKVELTFKSGNLKRETAKSAADLKEGQKVAGVVRRIEAYGLFIDVEGTKLHGLCHKSQLSDNPEADVDEALQGFRVGDRVKAKVIGTEKGRISLGLKPSLFDEKDFEEEGSSDKEPVEKSFGVAEDEDEAMSSDVEEDEFPSDSGEEDGNEDLAEDEDDDGDGDDDEMQIDIGESVPTFVQSSTTALSKPSSSNPVPSLTLSGGFQWFGESQASDDEESGSDDSDHEAESSKKKKKKRKEIEKDLTADMHTKTPETNSDFERLLLGSPNSSYLWIQYMSFQLQISEVDKAREIGRRAVKTISFREEQERLNVWIALLNVENLYGTDESIESTFKDAARANDSKTIHLRLAAIYDQSGKHERAEEQFKRTAKKFGKSCKVWTQFGEHFLKLGKLEEARNLLSRSMQSLEKRKHVKTVSRFAQMEYKLGDPERGRTLFEGIVDSHPKRWDLWAVYIDMEAGQKDIQTVRNLMNRVLALKMTSHKAKAFFKKWLDIEKRIGDEDGIAAVKAKAVDWTQRAASRPEAIS
ncbi:hypothetical protein EST38_g3267 [Candolleomyces aberdarensis]|uniref:S1 motif domain-containing protein n=1 Tax=Candolleomyces aberdarensis TaxID=2316362 RepID=A0A4Q2DSH4_9AGAR|nr:hypothetical protein EST38_g3267 [Candolleomyces aberdarensis]